MLDFLNGFAASSDLFADSCWLNLAVILPCSVAQSLSPVRQGNPRNREALALQRGWVHVASDPRGQGQAERKFGGRSLSNQKRVFVFGLC